MLTLHTLEARDNAFLDVTFDNPVDRAEEIRREISAALAAATVQLSQREIAYDTLRTALTPQVDRREVALLFNSDEMDSWYGHQAAKAVLPHLNRKGNNSILTGDIIWKDQHMVFAALNKEGTFWRDTSLSFCEQIYVVYVTNLSSGGLQALTDGVNGAPGAFGYVDCTFSGVTKTILSTCIGTRYVKVGRRYITAHPFDSGEGVNENAPGWPLQEFNYEFASIDDMYFDLFLQYKIENLVPGFAFNDGHFSLAAAVGIWQDPRSIPLFVEDAKKQYLEDAKSGSLAKAGLTNLSTEELARKIQDKLASSYIYNLVWNSEKNFSNFAAMIEFDHDGKRSRLRAALKYEDGQLGLVTLFG